MKKIFYYFAMAACVTLSITACGSDDEDYVAPKVTVELPLPAYASEALSYDDIAGVTSAGTPLNGVNFTEGGKAILEIGGEYYAFDYTLANGLYTLTDNGKAIGTVKENISRGVTSEGTTIEISINVTINGVTYSFNSANAAANKVTASEMISNTNLNNIARTWELKSMALALDGDVSMMKRYDNGDLSQLAKDANENGAGLTPDEMAELYKVIKSIEFCKNGKFYICYQENGQEKIVAAEWSSVTFENFNIKEFSEVNKFINSDSSIDVVFNEVGGCLFTFKTTIMGSKRYNAQLSVALQ